MIMAAIKRWLTGNCLLAGVIAAGIALVWMWDTGAVKRGRLAERADTLKKAGVLNEKAASARRRVELPAVAQRVLNNTYCSDC